MNKNKENIKIKDQIDCYLNGSLSEDEVDELWVHLIENDKDMDYLKNSANLKEIAREQEKPSRVPQVKGWMYAAAAAVLVLLVVIATMRFGSFNSEPTVEPVETIELDYYRAADNAATTGDREQLIRNALQLFNDGKFDEAIDLLNKERNEATDVKWIAKLNITLGTLHYNEDKFNDAAYYFNDVVQYKDNIKVLTLEKAYWYLGNSYFQMNMLEDAERIMKKTYALDGAYSRVAKSYLDAMENAMAAISE